ncbi:MAG: hypothetical protein ABIA63_09795 [bacterium]
MIFFKRQSGSSLTVTICATCALSFAGITMVSFNSRDVGITNFNINKTKAYYAAESGLEIGISWFNNLKKAPKKYGPEAVISDRDNIVINGYHLNVSVIQPDSNRRKYDLIAEAKDSKGKIMATAVQNGITFSSYQKRLLSIYGYDKNAFLGWGAGCEYYGDIFMNMNFITDISCLQSQDKNKYYGKVFTSGRSGFNYGFSGKNDYSRGIQLKYSKLNNSNYNSRYYRNERVIDGLDEIFIGGFEYTVPDILPENAENLSTDLSSDKVYDYNVIELVLGQDKIFEDLTGRDSPYIKFNDNGTFEFWYKRGDECHPSKNYYSDGLRHPVDETIIYSPIAVKVFGTVRGRATVVTGVNKDIIIDRDITYSSNSFNSDTDNPYKRILENGNDVLGLISGGDIYIPANPGGAEQDGGIDICGAIMALGTDTYNPGGLYDKRGGMKCDKANYHVQNIHYINIYGSFAMRVAKVKIFGNRGYPGGIQVYDRRFDDELYPPGMPLITSSDGYLMVERNTVSGILHTDR